MHTVTAFVILFGIFTAAAVVIAACNILTCRIVLKTSNKALDILENTKKIDKF